MFSGRPPLGYDALLCFCYLAYNLRVFLSALSSFWALSSGFSVFFVSWTNLLASGRPALLLFCIVDLSLIHI